VFIAVFSSFSFVSVSVARDRRGSSAYFRTMRSGSSKSFSEPAIVILGEAVFLGYELSHVKETSDVPLPPGSGQSLHLRGSSALECWTFAVVFLKVLSNLNSCSGSVAASLAHGFSVLGVQKARHDIVARRHQSALQSRDQPEQHCGRKITPPFDSTNSVPPRFDPRWLHYKGAPLWPGRMFSPVWREAPAIIAVLDAALDVDASAQVKLSVVWVPIHLHGPPLSGAFG
jgi:hypothetical protein